MPWPMRLCSSRPRAAGFPIHPDDKVRKDLVIKIPAGRTFDFRTLAHFALPDEKNTSAAQKLTLVGDSVQNHVISVDLLPAFLAPDEKAAELVRKHLQTGLPVVANGGVFLAAGDKAIVDLNFKGGYRLQSQTYRELNMHLFVFDHPYFAITKKDGSFTIPRVPAIGEVTVFAWQQDVGYLLKKKGKKMTLKEGKNTLETGANK